MQNPMRSALLSILFVTSLAVFSMYIATPSAGQQTVSAAATGRTLLTPVELSAGDNFTCARFSNARIKCWGRNNLGQLGYGDTATRGSNISEMGDNLPYVNLGTGRTAKKVVAGSYFACAILDNDTVKCWGSNESGQLGLGDTEKRGDDPNEMGDNLPTVQLGTGRTAKNLAVAFGSVCALLDTNNIKCWERMGLASSVLVTATTAVIRQTRWEIICLLCNSVLDSVSSRSEQAEQ